MATHTRSDFSAFAVPQIPAWIYLGLFAAVIALLGGASRPDAAQITLLRPLAALLLIPGLYWLTKDASRGVRVPLMLMGGLIIWMAIQITPLPPSIWQSLPDRDIIAALDGLAGAPDLWRPISMVPTRSLNSLASLVVPVAAILVALSLRLRARDLFVAIAALGVLDAVWGLLQLITGAGSPFYLYSITNRGSPVGLFANENHSGVFSSIVMVVSARMFLDGMRNREPAWIKILSAASFSLALFAVIVSASRTAFITGSFALVCTVIMVYLMTGSASQSGSRSKRPAAKQQSGLAMKVLSALLSNPRKLAAIGFVALIGLAVLFVLNGRAAGLRDILNKDAFEDLRWQLIPILQNMASVHWLVGTGFGSFEEVYHIYEPTELLRRYYLNQAHNDWAQVVIEGGLPAIVLIVALLGWSCSKVLKIFRGRDDGLAIVVFWAAIFGVVVAASIPDYPLRTPFFQAIMVWLVLVLATDSEPSQSGKQIR